MKTSTPLLPSFKALLFLGSFGLLAGALSAQTTYTYTDSVCLQSQDVVYGITSARSSSHYDWELSDPAAGSIDSTITGNNDRIEIDWSGAPGTYSLSAIENTAAGCLGDTVTLDVVISPLPTVALAADSICVGSSATLNFNLTGQAPWVVSYTDGTNSFTDTAMASPYQTALPAYSNPQTITVTSLSDGNTCAGDTSALPSQGINLFNGPSTGPIYHF